VKDGQGPRDQEKDRRHDPHELRHSESQTPIPRIKRKRMEEEDRRRGRAQMNCYGINSETNEINEVVSDTSMSKMPRRGPHLQIQVWRERPRRMGRGPM